MGRGELIQVTSCKKLRPPQQRGAENGVPALSVHEADRNIRAEHFDGHRIVRFRAWKSRRSLLPRPLRYRPLEDLSLFQSTKNRLDQASFAWCLVLFFLLQILCA